MRSKLKVIGVRPNVVATWCTVAVTESETPSPLATTRVEPFWSAEISASCEFPTRPCADTIAGARDTHANVTPGTAALSASRASAVSVAPSPSEENVWLPGVITIEPIRVRTACAELDTEVGVPLRTASAVMLVLPSRTPVTSPDAETRARVVSDEVHSKVKPLTATFPLSATAVSWRVPARTTVESPLTTTEVIVGGPPSPPPPPHPTTTPANPPTRIRRKRCMTAPRRRTLLGWAAPRWLSRWWLAQHPRQTAATHYLAHSINRPSRGPTIETLFPSSCSVPNASCACTTPAVRSLSRYRRSVPARSR